MTTIVEFLTARLNEAEAAARATTERQPYDEWDAVGDQRDDDIARSNWEVVAIASCKPAGPAARAVATHIALNDPKAVLADIAAKRKILELRSALTEELQYASTEAQHNLPMIVHAGLELDKVIKQLAVPFDQHPDFDEWWRP